MTYHVEVETEIEAPVEAVFDFIADTRNDPRWAPMVKSVRQTSGNGPAAGAAYRIVQWVGPGKTREMDMQLTVYDRPHHLEWLMANRWMDYRCIMRFEETKYGTRIVQDTRNVFKRSRMPRWISELLARRQLNKQFARLRKIFDGYDFTKPHTTTRW